MFSVYKMEYLHPTGEKSSVRLVQYDPKYREQYKKVYNESFFPMRKALGIEPYDFIQDDSFFEKGMEKVFLLLADEEIVGSVALRGAEIDDLFVAEKHRGKGYGKELLLWALENIKADRVFLRVAAWNERAVKLYEKMGFSITKKIKIG